MTITTEPVNVPERRAASPDHHSSDVDAVVEIVVPVHNEELGLEPSVRRLDAYLSSNFPYPYCITIADNASTDTTWQIAEPAARQSFWSVSTSGFTRGVGTHITSS